MMTTEVCWLKMKLKLTVMNSIIIYIAFAPVALCDKNKAFITSCRYDYDTLGLQEMWLLAFKIQFCCAVLICGRAVSIIMR